MNDKARIDVPLNRIDRSHSRSMSSEEAIPNDAVLMTEEENLVEREMEIPVSSVRNSPFALSGRINSMNLFLKDFGSKEDLISLVFKVTY